MSDNASKTLVNAIKSAVLVNRTDVPDMLTALTMCFFDAAVAVAITEDKDPSECLKHFIETMEDHFGEYLKINAERIQTMTTLFNRYHR